MQAHNYPWSREPSTFSAGGGGDGPAVTPSPGSTTLVNNSNEAGGVGGYGYFMATHPHHARPGLVSGHSFQNTGFNGATQLTSISAGPSSAEDNDASPFGMPSPMTQVEPSPILVQPGAPRVRAATVAMAVAGGSNAAGKGRRVSPRSKPDPNAFQRLTAVAAKFGSRLRNMDPVKLAYLRTSFVFAISVLVTWTPSSINRVYTLIYPDRASWGLNIAAAVVLPLQGVWNAVIYFTTSWKIFREEVETTKVGRQVLEFLRLDSGAALERRDGSLALVSSVRTPRSEMGRSRRLEGDSYFEHGLEMVDPVRPLQKPRPAHRSSTIRVLKKGLVDFA